MMKRVKQLLIQTIILLISGVSPELFAQRTNTQTVLEEGSVEEQFNHILNKSSTYNDYKAIKSSSIYTLRKNVFDTLNMLKADAVHRQNIIAADRVKIDSLTEELAGTQNGLAHAVKEKNSLQFLGIRMNKSVYNSITWLVIGILAISLAILILMYKRSHVVTVKALSDLEEIRDEFEKHRKRALERQEEVVRKYHAELNKYKSKATTNKSSG